MYSALSYKITEAEFNYLLPVLRSNLSQSDSRFYFISYNIDELDDMLNRLKGLYDYYDELKAMLIYKCSFNRSLKPFRDFLCVV